MIKDTAEYLTNTQSGKLCIYRYMNRFYKKRTPFLNLMLDNMKQLAIIVIVLINKEIMTC